MSSKIKQIILLAVALLLMLILGIFGETTQIFYNYRYDWFLFVLFVLLFFYLPLLFLYIYQTKKRKNTNNLNKVFRLANWLAIILTFPIFLFWVWVTFYTNYSDLTFWQNIWSQLGYYFSWEYRLDTEYGLLDDFKNLLPSLPFLVTPILFYWANRLNRQKAKDSSQDIVKRLGYLPIIPNIEVSDETEELIIEVLSHLPKEIVDFVANKVFFLESRTGKEKIDLALCLDKNSYSADYFIFFDSLFAKLTREEKIKTILHEIGHAWLKHERGEDWCEKEVKDFIKEYKFWWNI